MQMIKLDQAEESEDHKHQSDKKEEQPIVDCFFSVECLIAPSFAGLELASKDGFQPDYRDEAAHCTTEEGKSEISWTGAGSVMHGA